MSAMAAGEPELRARAASRRRTAKPVSGQRVLTAVPRRRTPATVPSRPAATAPARRAATVVSGQTVAPGQRSVARRTPVLALVPPQVPAAPQRPMTPGPAPGQRAGERARPAARRSPQPASAVTRPRSRLTRRGRIVVSALAVAVMLLVAVLAWLGGATRADAARSGPPPSAVYRNLTSVIVQPGQSLWAIAAQAEPGADPRAVIQEIVDLNALGGASIQPGQHLLVPRG